MFYYCHHFPTFLEYAITKFHENQARVKLKGIYLLLIIADNVNLLGDNTDTVRKDTEAL
jgi:hypothetical protein